MRMTRPGRGITMVALFVAVIIVALVVMGAIVAGKL